MFSELTVFVALLLPIRTSWGQKVLPFSETFFSQMKASELTRNQNGMLHYVRTACLVCFLRNNQEKLDVKSHRCSFPSNIFILLKHTMKKSSYNLEQYIFCISTYFIDLYNKYNHPQMDFLRNEFENYIFKNWDSSLISNSTRQ